MAGNLLGVPDRSNGELASADVDFTYDRLPVFRDKRRWTSFDQPAASRGKYGAGFPAARTDDWRNLAQRLCGSVVRVASTARRIRRLGG